MKKHTEKQPIDDLFARKLGNMSLQPGADAWETLQERMGSKPTRRLIPVWYRYAATAACVVVVSTIGWLSWPQIEVENVDNARIALVTTKARKADQRKPITREVEKEALPEDTKQLATSASGKDGYIVNVLAKNQHLDKSISTKVKEQVKTHPDKLLLAENQTQRSIEQAESVIAEANQPVEIKTEPTGQTENKKSAERTLIVSIATPTVALAANQPVEQKNQSLMSALDTDERVEKPTKASRFFRKLKQLKNGNEALAYSTNQNDEDEESGLISRLYGNVKHSIDSKKAEKR